MSVTNTNMVSMADSCGSINSSAPVDNQVQENPSIFNEVAEGLLEYQQYKDIVNEETDNKLWVKGLRPAETDSYFFKIPEKEYKEGDFECKEYKFWDGTASIVKTKSSLLGEAEYIIEEYDRKGKLAKVTHKMPDTSYTVSKYNKDGLVESEAKIGENIYNNMTVEKNLKITNYNNDRSYSVTEYVIKADESCIDDNKAIVNEITVLYDKNGNMKVFSSLLNLFLVSLIESTFNEKEV